MRVPLLIAAWNIGGDCPACCQYLCVMINFDCFAWTSICVTRTLATFWIAHLHCKLVCYKIVAESLLLQHLTCQYMHLMWVQY